VEAFSFIFGNKNIRRCHWSPPSPPSQSESVQSAVSPLPSAWARGARVKDPKKSFGFSDLSVTADAPREETNA